MKKMLVLGVLLVTMMLGLTGCGSSEMPRCNYSDCTYEYVIRTERDASGLFDRRIVAHFGEVEIVHHRPDPFVSLVTHYGRVGGWRALDSMKSTY